MARLGVWTEDNPYPIPRTKRAGPATSIGALGDALTSPIRSRLWPFMLVEVGNTRAVATSPRFLGPALVKAVRCTINGGGASPRNKMDLRWSPVPLPAGNNLTLATPPGGQSFFEPTAFFSDQADLLTPGDGFSVRAALSQPMPIEIPINFVITAPEFYISAVIRVPDIGTALEFYGIVTVLEAASIDDLIPLIG